MPKSPDNHSNWQTIRKITIKLALGTTALGVALDGGLNEFQQIGAINRFFRSLKIATEISFDYSWHLYGLKNGTDEYNKVCGMIFFLLTVFCFGVSR